MRLVPAEGPLLAQVLDASHAIWSDGLSRNAYGRWWDAQLRTAWGRAHLHRFALVDGDRLLASAKRYDFDATLDGRRVRVMGLGAVFTQPEHRGAGHARIVVEQMVEAGATAGFDYALLFSEIDPAYYARLGFTAVDLDDTRIEVIEKAGAPAALVRGGEERDLAAIADINRVSAESARFRLERSPELIQYAIAKRRLLAGLGPHGERELQFFVSEEGTAAVAYVVFTVHEHVWTIEECGDRDPTGARVGAILQVLLAREPSIDRPVIHGWLPDGWAPPQVRRVGRQPVVEVMMLRALGGNTLPPLAAGDVRYWHSDLF